MDQRIIRYYNGELSDEQRGDLLRESLIDPELRKDMERAQQIESLLALRRLPGDEDEGRESLAVFLSERRRERRRVRMTTLLRYAAVIMVSIVSTWWMSSHLGDEPTEQSVTQELTVPAGQRAHLLLSDGTGVWVNSGSTLRYPSVFGNERRVSIEGEAMFCVAKGERPFIVSAHGIDVKALGTKFNVFSYPDEDMTVALLEGSVRVYRSDKERDGVVMRPEQMLTVKGGRFEVEPITRDPVTWTDGIYAFDRQRLGDILRKMELYYNVRIKAEDPALLEYEYTGKFRQRDGVMEMLRIIQKIHPFKIEKRDDTNEIILRR